VGKELRHALKVQAERGRDAFPVIPLSLNGTRLGVLEALFGEEPTYIPVSSAPGGATAALHDILVAMRLRLPTDRPPVPQPRPEPVAELVLELSDLGFQERAGVRRPAARARQPEHTDFSPSLWDWDADGVRGTASRMEQLCVHALLVQLYAPELVSEGDVPPAPGAKGFGGAPPWATGQQKTACGGRCGLERTTSCNARPAVPSGASGGPSRPSPGPWRGRWSG
jgi:hypothetical protein